MNYLYSHITSPRTRLLAKNIAASLLLKGWSAATVFIMLPLTLHMLGVYTNGVWLTISSVFVWVDMLDIGLGNGARNAIARCAAIGDTVGVSRMVSSTLAMLIIVVLPATLIALAVVNACDIYAALGVDTTRIIGLNRILSVAVAVVCTTFIFRFTGNFYMGLQLPAANNLLLTLGQTAALAATAAAWLLGCQSLMTVVALNTLAPLAVWLLGFVYTFYIRYPQYRPNTKAVNFKTARSLCATGVQFFLLQVCSVVLFTCTNIIICHLFTPTEVTPYQVAFRYMYVMIVLFTIIGMPFWNATTDAYTRGDIQWIRTASHRLDILLLGIVATMALMTAISIPVYHLWMGADINVPLPLTIAMAAYVLTLIISQRYSFLINGIGTLRIQVIFTFTAALLFVAGVWIVSQYCRNITALVIMMCLVNIPGLIANKIQFHKLLNGTATGLWAK